MKALTKKLFGIREGEGFRAALMFAYIFLIVTSIMIMKPVRNSLFLTRFGISQLPYVFVLVAATAGVVVSIYSKFERRIRLNRLIFGTTSLSVICVLAFWFLLHINYQAGWFFYAFYIWVAIFSVITASQFWLLANYVFNIREAKRLFGFIGAGAISGGVFGGYLTNFLVPYIGTSQLLFLCIFFLLICIILLKVAWKKGAGRNYWERIHHQKRFKQLKSGGSTFKLIIGSPHLTYMAGIVGVSVIAANLIDYQFNAVASQVIDNEDRLTAFFGFWYSNLSIVALIIQLLFTSRLLKTIGVGTSLFFLPAGILIGAVAVILNPALWSAILIKMSDGGFKHSINKVSIELLSLPVPAVIKNRAKAFIDVFIDNLATGLGGLLLIALTVGLRLSVPFISLAIIVLIGLWIYFIFKAKKEYVNSFRSAIEKRTIDIHDQAAGVQDASVFENLINVLGGNNERRILYVLNLLENVKDKRLIPYFERLINFNSDEIKIAVLRMIRKCDSTDLIEEANVLIYNSEQKVRVEALRYVCQHSEDRAGKLHSFLSHHDYRIQAAAMMCVAREYRENKNIGDVINIKKLFSERLKLYRQSGSNKSQKVFLRANAAKIIGTARNPELYPYLRVLLKDRSTEVLNAAIVSAGSTRAREFIPILTYHLKIKTTRKYAREALAEYGEEIVEILSEQLKNPETDKDIRIGIPGVLSLIGTQDSVNTLISALDYGGMHLRRETVKSLNKLKNKFPLLKFNKRIIENKIIEEIKKYFRLLTYKNYRSVDIAHNSGQDSNNGYYNKVYKARMLLDRALDEKLDYYLERIFRLLGLKYQSKDMYDAYKGITSKRPNLKANAVEFLDNVLDSKLRRFIIPVVEPDSIDFMMKKAKELFDYAVSSEEEILAYLLKGEDDWLKTCALFLIGRIKTNRFIPEIEKLKNAPDLLVAETAEFALQNAGS